MSLPAPIYYNADQVREVLTWPLVNQAVKEALKAVNVSSALGDLVQASFVSQPRSSSTISVTGKQLFAMPSYVRNHRLKCFLERGDPPSMTRTLACKVVTAFPANEKQTPQVPNILANILLFNTTTGQLECIMEATQITKWRTAAASIIATKYAYFRRLNLLFPGTETIKVAIIGCDAQGESHALGMCATFQVSDIYLWNRTQEQAETLAELLRATSPATHVHVTEKVESAVVEVDVICIGTPSPDALLTADMLVKDDVHINVWFSTSGANTDGSLFHYDEIAKDIYDKALVYVDSMDNATMELKHLSVNIEGELGAIIKKRPPWVVKPKKGISIFHAMGMAAEDNAVGRAIFDALKSRTTTD